MNLKALSTGKNRYDALRKLKRCGKTIPNSTVIWVRQESTEYSGYYYATYVIALSETGYLERLSAQDKKWGRAGQTNDVGDIVLRPEIIKKLYAQ